LNQTIVFEGLKSLPSNVISAVLSGVTDDKLIEFSLGDYVSAITKKFNNYIFELGASLF
jgi:hypothetical protein